MRFPVTIRHRNSTAKIYAPGGKFAYYRLAYTTAGKRRMQTFANYSAAKAAAARIVRDLADGSQAVALNAMQSRDALAAFAPKTRNHYRAAVGQFLRWAARKDYLPVTHRLGEADGLRPEHANTAEISFYTPRELAALLSNAGENLRPLIAVGGLAGLRTAEMLRLDWADIWRVPRHIEITAGKAKTRQRRLVEMCKTLQVWLEPYRTHKIGKFWPGEQTAFQEHFSELCKTAEVTRKTNGLRHSFCSFHFALHANENLTAQQAGNSPAMIHAHYKGLATKAEAGKWFKVAPNKITNG